MTTCGLIESSRVLLAATSPAVIVCTDAVTGTGLVTARSLKAGLSSPLLSSPLTGLSHGSRAGSQGGVTGIVQRLMVPPRIAVTRSRAGSASAVLGSSLPGHEPSLRDLARLFLSLSGSREQWDAVVGSPFSAASASGAGSLPGPAAPEPVAVPSACSSA